MQIDWLTVAAQIVNFLVLVWLLQRFLYGPITRAMQRREQRIADRLREAERKKEDADDEARAYRERREELEERRDRLLAEAREAAEEERKALERAAREDVEARKRAWLAQLETERDAFLRELRRRSSEQFYELARRALNDLANADLEDQIALSFVRQLEGLDRDAKAKLARAFAKVDGSVAVRSRFELSANAKRQITKAAHEHLGEGAKIDYEAREDVACGIALKVGSQTLEWSFQSYLDGLEEALSEQMAKVSSASERRAGA